MNATRPMFDGLPAELTIPTITLWQPWAMWIAWGWKGVETRGHDAFRNLVGRRIAIHAGKRLDPAVEETAWPYLTDEQIERCQRVAADGWPAGVVVCTVRVISAHWLGPADSRAALCPCDASRFGLFLRDVVVVEPPIPWRGAQGVWPLPAEAIGAPRAARRAGGPASEGAL